MRATSSFGKTSRWIARNKPCLFSNETSDFNLSTIDNYGNNANIKRQSVSIKRDLLAGKIVDETVEGGNSNNSMGTMLAMVNKALHTDQVPVISPL